MFDAFEELKTAGNGEVIELINETLSGAKAKGGDASRPVTVQELNSAIDQIRAAITYALRACR